MMDGEALRWANQNPEAYRKQKNKTELNNEISNLESRLRVLKEALEDADDASRD